MCACVTFVESWRGGVIVARQDEKKTFLLPLAPMVLVKHAFWRHAPRRNFGMPKKVHAIGAAPYI
jgi:hypothetical protein